MQYLAAFLFFCVTAVSATEFRNCAGNKPKINSLEVTGCETLPCNFVKGKNVNMKINFTSTIPVNTMRPQVLATVSGFTVNYPLPSQNACSDLSSGKCPLNPGDTAVYDLTMPILRFYPRVSMKIEFSLLNQDGQVITCMEITGKVVSQYINNLV